MPQLRWQGTTAYVAFMDRIVFQINSGAVAEAVAKPTGEVRRDHKAYIFDVSGSRTEALKRRQMLRLIRIEYFQGVLDLGPGERWGQALYKLDAMKSASVWRQAPVLG